MAVLMPAFSRFVRLLVLTSVLWSLPDAGAGPYDMPDPNAKLIEKEEKKLCASTQEYIKTLRFLRESKVFVFREESSRSIAEEVSRGCDGAAQRFSQVLTLLKTVGMSDRRSLEMALEFAYETPDVQMNFVEIFTKGFLGEFFDYEFNKAMKIALELSRDYKGDPAKARMDFLELVRFCKDSKNLELPMSFCADYSVEVARLSQHYKGGVFAPFRALFTELRERKELNFDVKTALNFAYSILKNGPKAQDNFLQAFDFASKDLGMDKKKALEFANVLAQNSFVGEKPPVLSYPQVPQEPGEQ